MSKMDRDSAKRLMSYSMAAGLGAFAVGAQAEGAIIYTDVDPDFAVTPSGEAGDINFDNSGYAEAAIINTGSNIQARPFGDSVTLTSSGSYYARAFAEGALIGPDSNAAGGAELAATFNNYNFVGTGNYLGFQFTLDGNTHYGWARVDVDSVNPLNAILYGYAYESEPGVAIEAGAMPDPIPEPATLALLAAGAGSLAMRRRRSA